MQTTVKPKTNCLKKAISFCLTNGYLPAITSVLAAWLFVTPTYAQWNQQGADIDGEAAYDESGLSLSMPDANTVAIGAPYNDRNGTDAGHVRIYTWNASTWTQEGADIDGEAANDQSGISVSMPDANTVAIGASGNDDNGSDAGQVRIYAWNGSTWMQKGADIDGEAAGDNSGFSVSMPNANTVAIGATYNRENGNLSGHVRVYALTGVGINERSASDVLIHPNPTSNQITIDPGSSGHNTQVSIMSIEGRIVYYNAKIHSNKLIIDTKNWSKGIYIVNLSSEKENKTMKLIKQ